MRNLFARLVALALVLGIAAPAHALPKTKLKNDLEVTGSVTIDTNLTVTGTETTGAATCPSLILTGTNFNATVQATQSLGQATTYTIPDPVASTDNFMTTGSTQTVTGVKTMSGANVLTMANAGALIQNPAGTFTVQLTPSAELANRVLTIPLLGGADTIMTLGTAQTVTGVKTMSGANVLTMANAGCLVQNPAGTFTVQITPSAEVASRVLTIPLLGAADTIMTLGTAQTVSGVKTFSAVPIFPTGGITLQGTSFNGTVQEIAGLGQATTYTLNDPGAATANILDDSSAVSAITIQHVAVNLTNANIQNMYATPVQLIAAPAAGKNIMVHRILFKMITDASAYANGGVVAAQIGNTNHGGGTLVHATIPAAVVTAGAGTSYTERTGADYTSTAATGLFISNQTGAFTGGDSGATAVVDIWYSIK